MVLRPIHELYLTVVINPYNSEGKRIVMRTSSGVAFRFVRPGLLVISTSTFEGVKMSCMCKKLANSKCTI
jgi:hypothetical protein